jgi:predicted Zn-ribbon and HTH transcriptional regulator
MDVANFFRCGACGYEFLSKNTVSVCPRCKSPKLEKQDIEVLAGIDE